MADELRKYQSAVDIIKTAILQSQARAAKAVNKEQLALYYGIGKCRLHHAGLPSAHGRGHL